MQICFKNKVSESLLSTDKAVRPTNVMGASKLAELIVQAYAELEKSKVNIDKTKFSMVRFGMYLIHPDQ